MKSRRISTCIFLNKRFKNKKFKINITFVTLDFLIDMQDNNVCKFFHRNKYVHTQTNIVILIKRKYNLKTESRKVLSMQKTMY